MINRVRIEVGASKYVIATPEKEEYVQQLAQELNSQISQLMESNDRMSLNDALVLCALNYVDAYKKSEASADHMRSQLTDYLEDAAKARIELDEARREIDRLSRRLDMLGENKG